MSIVSIWSLSCWLKVYMNDRFLSDSVTGSYHIRFDHGCEPVMTFKTLLNWMIQSLKSVMNIISLKSSKRPFLTYPLTRYFGRSATWQKKKHWKWISSVFSFNKSLNLSKVCQMMQNGMVCVIQKLQLTNKQGHLGAKLVKNEQTGAADFLCV